MFWRNARCSVFVEVSYRWVNPSCPVLARVVYEEIQVFDRYIHLEEIEILRESAGYSLFVRVAKGCGEVLRESAEVFVLMQAM